MIARSQHVLDTSHWRTQLREAYRDPVALLSALGLESAGLVLADKPDFPFRVTRSFAARMRHGDAHDPLLRQVLPLACEADKTVGYSADPLAEITHFTDGSLIRKYHGRALLIVTGACAIHCRYCFRREFPYGNSVGADALSSAIATIAADRSLSEVILSGGDPLVLDDAALSALVTRLAAIPHVERLRIHSRLPVVLPARITPALLAALGGGRLQPVLVIHANHAHEIDDEVKAALSACRDVGITLLNQAVLLRGVNDSATILAQLSETLFAAGVLPYYLHLLDRVRGAAHFDAGDARAAHLERELRALLPGYLVPRFVREVAGASGKVPLDQIGEFAVL